MKALRTFVEFTDPSGVSPAALTEAETLFRRHSVRACADIAAGIGATQPAGRLRTAAPVFLESTPCASVLADRAGLHRRLRIDESMMDEAPLRGAECRQLTDCTKMIPVRPQGRNKADRGTTLVNGESADPGVACFSVSLIHKHLESGAPVPVMTSCSFLPVGAHVLRPPSQHPCKQIRSLIDLLEQHATGASPPLAPARRKDAQRFATSAQVAIRTRVK
jgi:hypothetical protein